MLISTNCGKSLIRKCGRGKVHIVGPLKNVLLPLILESAMLHEPIQSGLSGCRTGNGKELSSSQAQLGQATSLAVA